MTEGEYLCDGELAEHWVKHSELTQHCYWSSEQRHPATRKVGDMFFCDDHGLAVDSEPLDENAGECGYCGGWIEKR